ncbi:MAG: hypothetical protein WCA78_04395 [Rhizomicrobium sp.]
MELGKIEELAQRYKVLADQLRLLNREGSGLCQNVNAEIDKMIDDITGTVESHIMRIDSQNLLDQSPKGQKRP